MTRRRATVTRGRGTATRRRRPSAAASSIGWNVGLVADVRHWTSDGTTDWVVVVSGSGLEWFWWESRHWDCLCGTNMLYPLASLSQISFSPSLHDGLPSDLELDLRAYGCKLIHQAGILLTQSVVFFLPCVIVLTLPENMSQSPLPKSSSSDSGMPAR